MIQVLDQDTINQIAAGEVIERPAAVVKELVENAIDAKATAITIEIKEGGISFIRITDNGSGIAKEEISTAFLRHATSKIRTKEDLLTVHSLGFRGEALSSIAAVAQVELVTRQTDEITGARYEIEGGREKSMQEIGCPEGTTFIVRNLFFNTPARRKFLKTKTTEGGYVQDLVLRYSLAHPDIRFHYISDGKNKLQTSGDGKLETNIFYNYGPDITRCVIPVELSENGMKLSGFIGKPELSRGNRTFINYFVNGRYIKSPVITGAIEHAYKNYLMSHRYPFVVLMLDIDSSNIDVNVHPTKMEVRFTNQEEVYDLVFRAIVTALKRISLIPEVSLDKETKKEAKPEPQTTREKGPEPFERARIREGGEDRKPQTYPRPETAVPQLKQESVYVSATPSVRPQDMQTERTAGQKLQGKQTFSDRTYPSAISADQTEQPARPTLADRQREKSRKEDTAVHYEQQNLVTEPVIAEAKPQFRIIGQVFGTYWLVEYGTEMLIIDQHAAHEKVLYEKLMAHLEEKDGITQNLAAPIVVSLSDREIEQLTRNLEVFEKIGFRIEHFGEKDYLITGVPADFLNVTSGDLFMEMLDNMEDGVKGHPELILGHCATMACKAAVKGNHTMSFEEARELIGQMLVMDQPYHCPHGRPTTIAMSKQEFEKKFKRIV